jgi:ubiquinone/menaquinone biosynthesis C-methylase UbiE
MAPRGQAVGQRKAAMDRPRGEIEIRRGWQMAGLLGRFFAQFGRPSGPLGRLAGYLMARLDADDRWVVDLLDVQPHDRVLDIGFGPGVTIALIAERSPSTFVAGVDPSEVMLRQATRRNRAAMREGRIDLRLGTVSELPYPDRHFTKACAVHSLYFWHSVKDGLREVRRVLAPEGRLVIAVRMRHERAGRFDPSRFGLTDEDVAEIVATLTSVGFADVVTQRQQLGREMIAALLARRSEGPHT